MQKRRLSIDDIELLESKIDADRDIILLKILYETGCTVKEAVNIMIDNLDLVNGQIIFPADVTKSKIEKNSRISQELSSKISDYMAEAKKKGIKSRYLFASRQSEKMTTKRARQLILKYGRKAALGKVLPQMIRYAHIMHAFQKGLPIDAIARQTGLDKIRIVQISDAASEHAPDQYSRFFEGKKDDDDEKGNLKVIEKDIEKDIKTDIGKEIEKERKPDGSAGQ